MCNSCERNHCVIFAYHNLSCLCVSFWSPSWFQCKHVGSVPVQSVDVVHILWKSVSTNSARMMGWSTVMAFSKYYVNIITYILSFLLKSSQIARGYAAISHMKILFPGRHPGAQHLGMTVQYTSNNCSNVWGPFLGTRPWGLGCWVHGENWACESNPQIYVGGINLHIILWMLLDVRYWRPWSSQGSLRSSAHKKPVLPSFSSLCWTGHLHYVICI